MDIKEITKRYEFKSARGARYFVSSHIAEINADGIEHARQTAEGWQFDETAIRIMARIYVPLLNDL